MSAAAESPVARPATAGAALATVLAYRPDAWVALPLHAGVEVVDRPTWVGVPGGAAHGLGLMPWRAGWLPLIDLDALLHGTPRGAQSAPPRYALVVAWRDAGRRALAHGAVALQSLPHPSAVCDAMACPLPTDSALWPLLARSCFGLQGRAVPVLDAGRLFGRIRVPG